MRKKIGFIFEEFNIMDTDSNAYFNKLIIVFLLKINKYSIKSFNFFKF